MSGVSFCWRHAGFPFFARNTGAPHIGASVILGAAARAHLDVEVPTRVGVVRAHARQVVGVHQPHTRAVSSERKILTSRSGAWSARGRCKRDVRRPVRSSLPLRAPTSDGGPLQYALIYPLAIKAVQLSQCGLQLLSSGRRSILWRCGRRTTREVQRLEGVRARVYQRAVRRVAVIQWRE